MVNAHSLQGLLFPHSNTQTIQEVPAFLHSRSIQSIQSPTIWSILSPYGIYGSGNGGQTDGSTKGYKNPPVPRRLVGWSHIPPSLSPADPSSPMSGFNFIGYGFDHREGKVPKTLADPKLKNSKTTLPTDLSGQTADVPTKTVNRYRKTSPPRPALYETNTVAFEKQFKSARITRKLDIYPQVTPSSSKVVASGSKCPSRSTTTLT